MQYIYNPPLLVKYFLSSSLWYTENNKILLTFDDGPLSGNTDLILTKLDEYKIKALFFCVGNNVLKNPSVAGEILKEGHTIGNHTMNHMILNRADQNLIAGEILPFNLIMEEKFGYKVKYFRPPHGRYGFRLHTYLKASGLTNVMWSLLTYDYRGDLSVVLKSLKHLKRNSIVVFHDSIKSSSIISDSIDRLMEKAAECNYLAGSTEECLK